MTPIELQDELAAEIGRILSGKKYKTTGGERVPMNIYTQGLPAEQSDDDKDPTPYIIVKLIEGEDTGEKDSFNTVKTVTVVELWDENPDKQGYRDVMEIIHKVYARFAANPSLNNRGVFTGYFKWETQDDAYYPFFLGAFLMDFYIPAVRREDPFL